MSTTESLTSAIARRLAGLPITTAQAANLAGSRGRTSSGGLEARGVVEPPERRSAAKGYRVNRGTSQKSERGSSLLG
jgi:hypothetical protein